MLWTILLIITIGIGFRLWLSPPTRRCRSQRCLVEKTVLITGGSSGIGYQAALDFAKRGAKVIIACEDKKEADEARDKIIQETDNNQILSKYVDFRRFESVRAFAEDINRSEKRLDILANNVGIAFVGGDKTEDGHDCVMQVNYYSHFLLTSLLIGLMKKSNEPSRIVNTASLAATFAKLFDIDHIDKHDGNSMMYANSKLCVILFTKELAKRLQGSKITTYSLHPGAFRTGLFRNAQGFAKLFFSVVTPLFCKGLESCGQTIVYCSLEKNLEMFSGDHFDNCRRVSDYSTVKKELSRKLWELTEEIVQEKFN